MDIARIHLCRHGEVDPSWHGRIYGGHDVPLDGAGRSRFDDLASELSHLPLAAVYASDLARATDGAGRIASVHGLEVRVDHRFREIDRGAWVGLSVDEIEDRWPGGAEGYMRDPDAYREHGGENHAQLGERVMPALEDLAARHRGEEVLVVCHGQVMRVVIARVLRIPGAESLNLMTAYGGLTTIDHYADGAWVVQAVNAPVVRRGSWGGRTFKP